MLAPQPLNIDDFSGGLTDFFIDGKTNQYLDADNLFIGLDGELDIRPGSDFWDTSAKRLPSNDRITGITEFGDSLWVNSGAKLYRNISSVWTEILGPTGNPALGIGDNESLFNSSEWRGHLFLNNDSLGRPMKMYKDGDGVFQLRTAGLPSVSGQVNIDDGQLLGLCSALANDLLDKLKTHIQDVTLQHHTLDAVNEATLLAVSDATDEASMFLVVAALNSAYESHVLDALSEQDVNAPTLFHGEEIEGFPGFFWEIGGPNVKLKNKVTPTTLAIASTSLNDLRQKYFWHIWAFRTHFDPVGVGGNAPTANRIPTIASTPIVEGNLDQTIAYLNEIKSGFLAHMASVGGHSSDSDRGQHWVEGTALGFDSGLSGIPDATDYDSGVIVGAYMSWSFYLHILDSRGEHTKLRGDIVSGSAVVTNLIQDDSGNTVNNLLSGFLIHTFPDGASSMWNSDNGSVKVVSGSSGTFTMDDTASFTANQQVMYVSTFGLFHSAERAEEPGAFGEDDVKSTVPTSYVSLAVESIGSFNDQVLRFGLHYNLHAPDTDTGTSSGNIHRLIAGIELEVSEPVLVSYLYAFHFFYEYEAGALTFQDNGPVSIFSESVLTNPSFPIDSTNPDQRSVEISNIFQLINGFSDNWDTDNIKVKIFRTLNAGATFHSLGEVDNGVSTFTDTVNDTEKEDGDTALQTRTTMYTTGGVVGNDTPPKCKVMHVTNNVGYYGNIVEESGDSRPTRVLQSKVNDPDSVPSTFFDDLDDDVTAISSIKGNVIAFTKQGVYRMVGQLNTLGQGIITHERISDTVGTESPNSLVETPSGLFWAGTDGFYFTDAFQILKVSFTLDKSYQKFIVSAQQRNRIIGGYDRLNQRVWWGIQDSENAKDINRTYVLDLKRGVKVDGVFTRCSGGVSDNYSPTFIYFDSSGSLITGDRRGYLLKYTSDKLTDPQLDTVENVTNGLKQPLIYNYASPALDFGASFLKKWITRITFNGRDTGSSSIQINSVSDDNRRTSLKPIRHRGHAIWGDSTKIWGTASDIWNSSGGLVQQWRRFLSGDLRATFKQIKMTNADVNIANSDGDTYGTMEVQADTSTTRKLLLEGGQSWPPAPEGYTVTLAEGAFTVLRRGATDDEVIVSDSVLAIAVGTAKTWTLSGIPKFERFNMLQYTMHFSLLSRTHTDFDSKNVGAIGE